VPPRMRIRKLLGAQARCATEIVGHGPTLHHGEGELGEPRGRDTVKGYSSIGIESQLAVSILHASSPTLQIYGMVKSQIVSSAHTYIRAVLYCR
jgi:hypothetical protein